MEIGPSEFSACRRHLCFWGGLFPSGRKTHILSGARVCCSQNTLEPGCFHMPHDTIKPSAHVTPIPRVFLLFQAGFIDSSTLVMLNGTKQISPGVLQGPGGRDCSGLFERRRQGRRFHLLSAALGLVRQIANWAVLCVCWRLNSEKPDRQVFSWLIFKLWVSSVSSQLRS